MGWLDPEELKQLLPAETLAFPSPSPTQSVSSEEFMPVPQTAKQREFEARVKEYGAAVGGWHKRSSAPFTPLMALSHQERAIKDFPSHLE